MLTCKACGTKNNDINTFCTKCKAKLLNTSINTNDKIKLLKDKLPIDVQNNLFFPDDIYKQYFIGGSDGIRYMAKSIFDILKIPANNCIVDFVDSKMLVELRAGDVPGIFTKRIIEDKTTEIILVNTRYCNDPFAIGAVLAHEIMHLYLDRLGIRLEDVRENELLTDLATIYTGLPLLVINGYKYSSNWWLTIILVCIGFLYWRTEKFSFGYFKPEEYSRFTRIYLKERGSSLEDVIGFIKPDARYYLSNNMFIKPKHVPNTIKILEKQKRKTNIIQVALVAVCITCYIVFMNAKQQKGAELAKYKTELIALNNQIETDKLQLTSVNNEMEYDKKSNDINDYNNLVNPHNKLIQKITQEIGEYNSEVDKYNRIANKNDNVFSSIVNSFVSKLDSTVPRNSVK